MAAPPSAVWIDDRLVVRPSPIEGNGLFATSDIPVGTVVVRMGGRLVSTPELAELIAAVVADPELPYVDTITIAEDAHLVLPPGTAVHFANHSCDPALWHVGPYELATRRAVAAGDEVTVDYGTNSGADGFTMTCRCRAATCRGAVSSADWRRPDLQERYRGHWVPALQRRIEQLASEGPAP